METTSLIEESWELGSEDGGGELSFSHHMVLDPSGKYHMSWLPGEQGITFKLEVETLGFVGLGFSDVGRMAGADIVIAWVDDDDGEVHLTDRHGLGNFLPPLDNSQDLELLMGYQNTSHTVVQFYRAWDTCDKDDLDLRRDTVKIIWSYHQEDRLQYHTSTQRGAENVQLSEPPHEAVPLEPHQVWDVTERNMTVPTVGTYYHCRIVKIPEVAVESKHHIIDVQPKITPGNEPYVHHLMLRECKVPWLVGPSTADVFEEYVGHPGSNCFSPEMPPMWGYCHTVYVSWAAGGRGLRLPQHVGFPMGDNFGGSTFYRIEVHYNNPELHSGIVDNSGLRISYTDNLREMDAGVIRLGTESSMLLMIPPLQEEFTATGYCPSECTRQSLPEDGITVFSWFPHTHLAGRKLRVRQIRDGVELPRTMEDNNFDAAFQANREPAAEVRILPGDTLLTECVYSTAGRSVPTHGGLSTQDEMCFAQLFYYPVASLGSCHSGVTFPTLLKSLGIQKVVGDSFEKFMSFTYHKSDFATHDWNRTEVINDLVVEVGLTNDILKTISTEDFYRDWKLQGQVLIILMKNLKIELPTELDNYTIGDLIEKSDWPVKGLDMSRVLAKEFQKTRCQGHDIKPLIEYEPLKIPEFFELEKEWDFCD